ncbi:MAG: alpha/beta fold hydrolase [Actinobacteria bacterium]|nr:alpha/beta fold hydrolase [Actinomycetota bacterium]
MRRAVAPSSSTTSSAAAARTDRPRSSGACRSSSTSSRALREQLELDRVHLLGTSWGGMLALEHARSGYGGLTSLILSSTLANAAEWETEVKRLRDELPLEVLGILEQHQRAGRLRQPGVSTSRGRLRRAPLLPRRRPPPELERMLPERGHESYRAMWGPNEWTLTGALRGWDVRPRLHELELPALVLRGRYDLSTEAIAATLAHGLPDAREVVFEHSSHTPVLEETERYLDVVRSFLREVEEA